MDNIYRNIRKRRLELDMTQDELAKKVGYTGKSMIARIESGMVDLPLPKVVSIAKALSIDPIVLLGWNDEYLLDPEEFDSLVDSVDSDEEKDLLNIFNSMNQEGKQIALNVLRGLATQYQEK